MNDNFNKVEVVFNNRRTTFDLSDTFPKLNDNLIEIYQKPYRSLYKNNLSLPEYDRLINQIKLAVSISESLSIDFFVNSKDELEPLYSDELDHYDIDVDLISYKLSKEDPELPNFEFDVLVYCMDKKDQPVFLYDYRGTCVIRFQLNSRNELAVIEIS